MDKERIEDIRQSVIPFVKKELLEINNDGLGESDAKEFEKDLNEVLNIASKALEQPTTQEILSCIETGITATGQSDSYCVGFCNALIWLKACITHEEPQFFGDSTPMLSKAATNGDMVKAMFPNTRVCNTFPSLNNDEVYYIFIDKANGATNEMRVMKSWWNAPYKRK